MYSIHELHFNVFLNKKKFKKKQHVIDPKCKEANMLDLREVQQVPLLDDLVNCSVVLQQLDGISRHTRVMLARVNGPVNI